VGPATAERILQVARESLRRPDEEEVEAEDEEVLSNNQE
jgi:hypothetical protein